MDAERMRSCGASKALNEHIYDDVRLLVNLHGPSSLYPLNKSLVRICGSLRGGTFDIYGRRRPIESVQLKIDDGEWITIPLRLSAGQAVELGISSQCTSYEQDKEELGAAACLGVKVGACDAWEYEWDARQCTPGQHTILIRLYNGKQHSRALMHRVIIVDGDSRTDLESLAKAATWIHSHAWDENGKFRNYAGPTYPYEYVHVALGPYIIGCLQLSRITGQEHYSRFAEHGLARLAQKQLPNGGTKDDRRMEEESLDSAWASYCYGLACEILREKAGADIRSAGEKAIRRLKEQVELPDIKNWYPYFPKHPERGRRSRRGIRLFAANRYPLLYARLREIRQRRKSIDPIGNYQARAIWALAKHFALTGDAAYWETAVAAMDEYVKIINPDGSMRYCHDNPVPYLYYISWSIEAILEFMLLGKRQGKDVSKYERAVHRVVDYLFNYVLAITSTSWRLHFELNCKAYRGQGRGQGTTPWIMTMICTLSLFNRYFGSNQAYDFKPFLNYAKTLQREDGSFPLDEWSSEETSLWAACCYLHAGAVALLPEGALP